MILLAAIGRPEDPDPWPAVATQPRPWDWPRSGPKPPRGDRQFREFDAAVPPAIATRAVRPGPEARAALAAATEAVAVLDRSATVDLTALAGALLRSESVASSRIEHLRASQRDVGVAMIRGGDPHSAATHVAANVRAMTLAVTRAADGGGCTVDDLLDVHRTLLAEDPEHADWAGHLRDRPELDRRQPPLPPGRALHPAAARPRRPAHRRPRPVLQPHRRRPDRPGRDRARPVRDHPPVRRRQRAHRTCPGPRPPAAARADHARPSSRCRPCSSPTSTRYFAGLTDYRAGRLDVWLARFAAATSHAASAGLRLARDLAELRAAWWDAARPRRGSVGAVLLEALLRQPVVDIDTLRVLAEESGADGAVADKNLYRAVDRLVDADVLTEVSGGARNRVWAALDVLDLLERFETDLGRRRAPV